MRSMPYQGGTLTHAPLLHGPPAPTPTRWQYVPGTRLANCAERPLTVADAGLANAREPSSCSRYDDGQVPEHVQVIVYPPVTAEAGAERVRLVLGPLAVNVATTVR